MTTTPAAAPPPRFTYRFNFDRQDIAEGIAEHLDGRGAAADDICLGMSPTTYFVRIRNVSLDDLQHMIIGEIFEQAGHYFLGFERLRNDG